ncbi:RagB/SusD family nutrient uptake outer membrane protein [Mucilaginibacter sp. 44-25]|uniref:RagB/SusD family nutrient uptake outer membrane protein n=1 Tax=Mucilaginibacter sp. 44-25 TaxID=1895794 RepID=UPI00095AF1C0|nr:RagB/SusD family nutrient uptake outer membrane protein [Mucilaginibacter sp. 44-25]OJW14268.1 MAG: hypothetical protein BGO48_09050 [Mucilaginibacter sp. 44-25]
MKKTITLLLIILVYSSCKKLIEVNSPQNQLTTIDVFSDTTSAVAALGNIYAQLDRTIEVNYSKYLDMYTDNLDYTGSTPQDLEFLKSTISVSNSTDLAIWKNFYLVIYQCNNLIEHLPKSGNLPVANVNQLSNEAKFLRAYAYFYLVNLYGKVPLVLSTDVNISAQAPQSEISVIYQQIIKDLTDAKQGLPAAYTGIGKIRANKWAAVALLSKAYLFQQNWTAAESEATDVIKSGLYSLLSTPNNVFLAGSDEAILQVWTQNGFVTSATNLVPSSNTSLPRYPMSANLHSAFEDGDLRKTAWIGTSNVRSGSVTTTYHYLYKYKNRVVNTTNPEYLMVLRLAEIYLIRAEARAQQSKITGVGSAADDLNLIRKRSGIANSTATTQSEMLTAIMRERRVELFDEWGSRFFDLKRNGQLNVVIGTYKTSRLSTAALLPIPLNELTYDHNLVQNPGYH